MRNHYVLLALALLAVAFSVEPALSWGASGHSIVAEIAQQRLPAVTRRRLAALLGPNRSLASVANWADTHAALNPGTRRWHYVNIPVGADSYDAARDCRETPEGDCLVAAIERSQRVLADRRTAASARLDAVRFLVHLVADAHQPLHCAERDGDAGGGKLKVNFFGTSTNLHLVWDYAVLDRASYDWGEHLRVAEEWLQGQSLKMIQAGQPLDWILETHRLAGTVAYDLPADLNLGPDYQDRALPVARQQLAKAGARLAAVLVRALGRSIF